MGQAEGLQGTEAAHLHGWDVIELPGWRTISAVRFGTLSWPFSRLTHWHRLYRAPATRLERAAL